MKKYAYCGSSVLLLYSDITNKEENYTFSKWFRIHSASFLKRSEDSQIINIGVGRSNIYTLSKNNLFSIYSLSFVLQGQFKLPISLSINSNLFSLNQNVSNEDDSTKRIALNNTVSLFHYDTKIISTENSCLVWFKAKNFNDLLENVQSFKLRMLSNRHCADLIIIIL